MNSNDLDCPKFKYCYECDEPCFYLFPDSRCKYCTRITIEELVGETTSEEERLRES
jgi:hypothetical protein